MLKVDQFQSIDSTTIDNFIDGYNINQAIVSTVKKDTDDWQLYLSKRFDTVQFSGAIAIGVNIKYLTPETLGADRLAAVTGARWLYPGVESLVIGGGTCITYDYVDALGSYFGGSISPGLNMRYKALNYYTAGLPLLARNENFAAGFGNDTTSSIISGVQNGIKHELKGFINSYSTQHKALNIILTGGDSIFFDSLLKNSIFAPCIKIEPYLVLKGLNAAILNNND